MTSRCDKLDFLHMKRGVCEVCGAHFVNQQSNTRFCTPRCRRRAYDARVRERQRREKESKRALFVPLREDEVPSDPDEELPDSVPLAVPSVFDRVKLLLASVDDDRWEKAVALRLAYRLDRSTMEPAMGMAKLISELERLCGVLGVNPSERVEEDDFLEALEDEIGAARQRRRA